MPSVFAVVVLVEEYGETGWLLPGASRDAWLVVQELLRLDVAPQNIALFLSPEAAAKRFAYPAEVRVRAATRQVLEDFFLEELSKRTEDWLFLFWGGHGVVRLESSRHVLYGDAVADNKLNLDLEDFLGTLRSRRYPRFLMQQAIVVDACANRYESLSAQTELPRSVLPRGTGTPVAGRKQWFFFGSAPGEKARHEPPVNRAAAGALTATGLYTEKYLQQLRRYPEWPPDFDAIAEAVRKEFEHLRQEGQCKQTPGIFFRNPGGEGYEIGSVRDPDAGGSLYPEEKRQSIRDAVAALDLFQTEGGREVLFDALPWPVSRGRSPQAGSDAAALSEACGRWSYGLEALLDALERLDAVDLEDFAARLDERCPTLAITWTESTRLRRLLREAGPLPADADAAGVYRTVLAATDPVATRSTAPDWAAGRRFLFDLHRLAQITPVGQALFAYLDRCLAGAASALRDAGARWQAEVRARLRSGSVRVLALDLPAIQITRSALQIQFEPPAGGRGRATAWWRAGDRLEQPTKIHEGEEIAEEDWPKFVRQAFEETLERLADGELFRVEIIVPLRFFEAQADVWAVPNGRFNRLLGHEYPVVIRPYERIHTRSYRQPQQKWKRKWSRWRADPSSADVLVATRPADYTPEMFRRCEDDAAGLIACSLEPQTPPVPELTGREGVVESMIAAGLPVALCWRQSPPEGASTGFTDWLRDQPLDQWPEKIWDYRRGEHRGAECPAGSWPPLTLLWDDPNFLPPDREQRDQGPTQRPVL